MDECLPVDFRHSFEGLHDAHSVEWAGFKGKKNGELLRAAEMASYDVLVTVDRAIIHQTNAGRALSIVIIHSKTNRLDLLPLAPGILHALATIIPGQIVSIG